VDRRITEPAAGAYGDVFNNVPAGNIMRELVRRHCATAGAREIPFLTVEDDQGEGGAIDFTSRYKALPEELMSLSLSSGLGWDIEAHPGSQAMVFRVLTGQDRTFGNTEGNSHAVFGPQYDNLDELEFVDSSTNYRNLAVVGGQGEGTARQIVLVYAGDAQPEGLARWETFIDARDLSTEASLLERGRMRLDETPGEFSLTGKTIANRNLALGEDYDLGDMVTIVQPAWGVRLDTRITGIREEWSAAGYKALAQFGSTSPTLDALLRNRVKNMEGEINR
jgi:hypothetical protein